MLIYIRQFTSAVYCGMLLSKSCFFDQDIYFYSSRDLMPVFCQQANGNRFPHMADGGL